jgi:site-specific recombinase XerD
MKIKNKLMTSIQSFFQEYLVVHRGLSQNTIMAYRDTLKLFFSFESAHQNKSAIKLVLEDLNAESVLAFLNDCEIKRKNSIVTRNLRLAALKTFSLYMSTKDIVRIGEYQKIMALPLKRSPRKVIDYLEVNEVQLILESIDRTKFSGQRDYVLLKLLYNTGARVQEICDLKVNSITFGHVPVVTIVGKGKKIRQVPIWPETAKLLQNYLKVTQLLKKPDATLFMNLHGESLGRHGVRYIIKQRCSATENFCLSLKKKTIGPHTFRHTTAMHFLQAGVGLSIIKSWLGHVNLETTHAYIEIDMKMKRKALEACSSVSKSSSLKRLLDKNKDVLTWLDSISKS